MRVALAILVLPLLGQGAVAAGISAEPGNPDSEAPVRFIFQGNGTLHWDFGDGNSSTGRDVQHRFVIPGLYTVTVHRGNATLAVLDILVRIPSRLLLGANTTQASSNQTEPQHRRTQASDVELDPLLLVGAVLLVAVIGGGAFVYLRRKGQEEPEESNEAPEETQEDEAQEGELDLDDLLPLPEEAPAAPREGAPPGEPSTLPKEEDF